MRDQEKGDYAAWMLQSHCLLSQADGLRMLGAASKGERLGRDYSMDSDRRALYVCVYSSGFVFFHE